MKSFNRIISFFMAMIMLFCIFSLPFPASASAYNESENNNDFVYANNIGVWNAVYGYMGTWSDSDYFRFDVPKRGLLSFTFQSLSAYAGGVFYVQVYKSKSNAQYERLTSDVIYATGETFEICPLGVDPGTYYVKVFTSGNTFPQNVRYCLNSGITVSNDWETELNNNYGTADNLTLGKITFGFISDLSTSDWYKFTLKDSNSVKIAFQASKGTDASLSWNVFINKYNGNGSMTQIAYKTPKCSGTVYTYILNNLSAGTYYIQVKSGSNISFNKNCLYGVNAKVYVPAPENITIPSIKATSIKLSWNKVSSASGYQLQKESNGKFVKIANTKKHSYTVSDLKSGTPVRIRIRTYRVVNGNKYYSDWSGFYTCTCPAVPSLKKLSTSSKHTVTAKWSKVARRTGYQIAISRYSDFRKYKTVTVGSSKTSSTIKKLTKGKTYYVTVRSYKKYSGDRYYSAWSNVKKIKCK